MPKLFVISDVHSFLTPLKEALDKAGFDENNENHYIVSCGDLFDRGPESEELFRYIMSLPRKILVKGNHDILLEELCTRGFPYSHDKHNGTVDTVKQIGGYKNHHDFEKCCEVTYHRLTAYRFILKNYFETKNYIFVHSWIPTNVEFEGTTKPWYQQGKTLTWMEDWRNGNDVEWEEAMWGNPFSRASQELNKTGKTIVFGHWHCSAGHVILGNCNSEFEYAIWEPCYFKNTIGIDRCTAHTGEVNVLVLEDEFIE